MGWEKRDRGGFYYTRSKKIGNQVVREYVGTGPLATLAAEMDALNRQRRQEEAEAWRVEQRVHGGSRDSDRRAVRGYGGLGAGRPASRWLPPAQPR